MEVICHFFGHESKKEKENGKKLFIYLQERLLLPITLRKKTKRFLRLLQPLPIPNDQFSNSSGNILEFQCVNEANASIII